MCSHVPIGMIHIAPLSSVSYETVMEPQYFKQYENFKLHDFWEAEFRVQVFLFEPM